MLTSSLNRVNSREWFSLCVDPMRSVSLKSFLKKGSFLHSIIVLGSGTALAQVIPVLVSPLLTRLYSPQDFGMLSVFMAIVGVFSPIVCGKYEVALVLPKSKVQAEHLWGIALYFSVGISFVLFLVLLLLGDSLISLLNADKLGNWIFFAPVALLLTGSFTATNYWANRNKHYKVMSQARVTRSIITAFISIIAGVVGFGFGGLLTGLLLGLACASLLLLYHYRTMLKRRVFLWNKSKENLLCKYRHYPIYNATTGLLNGLTFSLPVFFLSRYFSDSTVGYYALVVRVTSTPVSFIASSVSQVNLRKVVDLVNINRPVGPYLLRVAGFLLLVISIPAFVIVVWGPSVFAFVFGKQWAIAGEYARILMPAIAVQFVSSTLSSTLGATNNNEVGAYWKITSFIVIVLLFSLIAPKRRIFPLLYAFSLTNFVLYCLYFGAIFWSAKKPKNE